MSDEKKPAKSKTADTKEKINLGLIMPIAPMAPYPPNQFEDVRAIITEAITSIEDIDFKIQIVSESNETAVIQNTIVKNIYNFPIVVIDVSGKNANVMFEFGMRLAFDMPVVVIKDDKTDYSFDSSPIKTLNYPSSLRHTDILEFQEELKSAIISTYEKYINSKDSGETYSPYLKSFGDLTVKKISNNQINTDEALSHILEKLDKLENSQSKLETPLKNESVTAAKVGYRKYYDSLLKEDFKKWSNINFNNPNSDSFKEWEKKTLNYLVHNQPDINLKLGDAVSIAKKAINDYLPF